MSWGGQRRDCHLFKESTLCNPVYNRWQCGCGEHQDYETKSYDTCSTHVTRKRYFLISLVSCCVFLSSKYIQPLQSRPQDSDFGQRLTRHGPCSCSKSASATPQHRQAHTCPPIRARVVNHVSSFPSLTLAFSAETDCVDSPIRKAREEVVWTGNPHAMQCNTVMPSSIWGIRSRLGSPLSEELCRLHFSMPT